MLCAMDPESANKAIHSFIHIIISIIIVVVIIIVLFAQKWKIRGTNNLQ